MIITAITGNNIIYSILCQYTGKAPINTIIPMKMANATNSLLFIISLYQL